MAVENLKFWHWMLLGAIAGTLVGYASTLTRPERDPLMRQPMTAQQFAAQLGKVVDGQPLMREIVIHPQRDRQNFVTGEILEVDRYHPFAFYAAAPFVTGQTQSASVLEYVKDRASRDRHISFQYPWTEAGWFIIASRAVAGLVLIGCVWPVLLNLMIGAGLGRKRPSEPEYVLDRFKSEPSSAPQQTSSADVDHLRDLERELEENLRNSNVVTAQAESTAKSQTQIRQLSNDPIELAVPLTSTEEKDYRGEFYPVEKPHGSSKTGFSLVELIVVIGIIAILLAMLFPAIKRARQSAQIALCKNNLREIGNALQMYLNDNQNMTFWRGEDLDTDGMDWYAYGGRETGNANLAPANYFNRIIPRPLNRYLAGKLQIFHCPNDDAAPWTYDLNYTIYRADSQFDWVGNSYNFNANGYPLRPQPRRDGGLDGERFSAIRNSSQTVVFYEACTIYGFDWHFAHKANVAFADNHVEFIPLPPQNEQYRWNVREPATQP